jgi:vacuolar-type H+-ATPase subunit D/Vma8
MHVWEKNEKANESLKLLQRYGKLLSKKRAKLLKEIKEFAKLLWN